MAKQSAEQLRELIRADAAELVALDKRRREIERRRDGRIKRARAMGVRPSDLARDSGLTAGRITQVAPAPESEPVTFAGVPVRLPVPADELPERYQPGAALGVAAAVSELVTRRPDTKKLYRSARRTIALDMVTGRWVSEGGRVGTLDVGDGGPGAILAGLPDAVQRVLLVAPDRPGVTAERVRRYGDDASAVRAWYLLSALPDGWEPAGHYIGDELTTPIGRWRHGDRSVEMIRAEAWFGDGPHDVDDVAHAWRVLGEHVRGKFGGKDRALLSTPSTTGRYLWECTIGPKAEYAVMSDELRALIQGTSGQGRWEITTRVPQIAEFVQYDMRFAYAKCTWGMPQGAPRMWSGRQFDALLDDERNRLIRGRGRWLVDVTVPTGWDHVGILPAPSADGLWCYPAEPGQTFRTWASGSELALALNPPRGERWHVRVREGFTWKESSALNSWKDKLSEIYATAEAPGTGRIGAMVRAAVRLVMLTSIGAFAARDHMVERTAPVSEGTSAIPRNAQITEVDGYYVWREPGEQSEWSQRMAHPEWSAEIWSRCRARLLDAETATPGVRAGALHVDRDQVLGMRTDALYLATDPGWADSGAIGLYRLKGKLAGPLDGPTDDAAFARLKSAAAAALAGGTDA